MHTWEAPPAPENHLPSIQTPRMSHPGIHIGVLLQDVGHTSVVSLAVRPPREGREGSDTLGSEGALMPDEAAAAAPAPGTTAALPWLNRHLSFKSCGLYLQSRMWPAVQHGTKQDLLPNAQTPQG